MSGWDVHDVEAVHVTPKADVVPHDLDMDCVCGPDVEFNYDRPVVTHHSLDGREAHE